MNFGLAGPSQPTLTTIVLQCQSRTVCFSWVANLDSNADEKASIYFYEGTIPVEARAAEYNQPHKQV